MDVVFADANTSLDPHLKHEKLSSKMIPYSSLSTSTRNKLDILSAVEFRISIIWILLAVGSLIMHPFSMLYMTGKLQMETLNIVRYGNVNLQYFLNVFFQENSNKIAGLKVPNFFGIFMLKDSWHSGYNKNEADYINISERLDEYKVTTFDKFLMHNDIPHFLDNYGTQIIIFAIIIVLILLVQSIKLCTKSKFLNNLDVRFRWNLLLSCFFGSYVSGIYYATEQIMAFIKTSVSTTLNLVSFIFAIIMLVLFLAVPIWIWLRLIKIQKSDEPWAGRYALCHGVFFKEKKINLLNNIFLLLKAVITAGIIATPVLNGVTQISILAAVSLAYLIYLSVFRPFIHQFYLIIQAFLEVILLFFYGCMLTLAVMDFKDELNTSRRDLVCWILLYTWVSLPGILAIFFIAEIIYVRCYISKHEKMTEQAKVDVDIEKAQVIPMNDENMVKSGDLSEHRPINQKEQNESTMLDRSYDTMVHKKQEKQPLKEEKDKGLNKQEKSKKEEPKKEFQKKEVPQDDLESQASKSLKNMKKERVNIEDPFKIQLVEQALAMEKMNQQYQQNMKNQRKQITQLEANQNELIKATQLQNQQLRKQQEKTIAELKQLANKETPRKEEPVRVKEIIGQRTLPAQKVKKEEAIREVPEYYYNLSNKINKDPLVTNNPLQDPILMDKQKPLDHDLQYPNNKFENNFNQKLNHMKIGREANYIVNPESTKDMLGELETVIKSENISSQRQMQKMLRRTHQQEQQIHQNPQKMSTNLMQPNIANQFMNTNPNQAGLLDKINSQFGQQAYPSNMFGKSEAQPEFNHQINENNQKDIVDAFGNVLSPINDDQKQKFSKQIPQFSNNQVLNGFRNNEAQFVMGEGNINDSQMLKIESNPQASSENIVKQLDRLFTEEDNSGQKPQPNTLVREGDNMNQKMFGIVNQIKRQSEGQVPGNQFKPKFDPNKIWQEKETQASNKAGFNVNSIQEIPQKKASKTIKSLNRIPESSEARFNSGLPPAGNNKEKRMRDIDILNMLRAEKNNPNLNFLNRESPQPFGFGVGDEIEEISLFEDNNGIEGNRFTNREGSRQQLMDENHTSPRRLSIEDGRIESKANSERKKTELNVYRNRGSQSPDPYVINQQPRFSSVERENPSIRRPAPYNNRVQGEEEVLELQLKPEAKPYIDDAGFKNFLSKLTK